MAEGLKRLPPRFFRSEGGREPVRELKKTQKTPQSDIELALWRRKGDL